MALLKSKGVVVGIGPQGLIGDPSMSGSMVKSLRFDAGWVRFLWLGLTYTLTIPQIAVESSDNLSPADALAMASSNIEKLLGIHSARANSDLVVAAGGDPFPFESKVVGMISSRRGVVDLF